MRTNVSLRLLGVMLLARAAVPASAADAHGEQNKQTLQRFLDEMRVAGYVHHDVDEIRAVVERYTLRDYVQHSKTVPPGQEGLINNYAAMTANWPPGKPAPNPGDLYFIADGDRVVWVSKKPDLKHDGSAGDGVMFQMVLFKNGKIAEHWDSLDRHCRE